MPRIFGSASTGSGGTPGGSTTQVQYNNAGAFGGVTGATTNGTFLTLTTPVLGVATGTSLALGGATIGSNALAVTGTAAFSSSVSADTLHIANTVRADGGFNFWNDVFWRRGGAATFQHGAADAASPVAQTIKFQDVATGTSNTAGVDATIRAPAGTGTGAGGSLIFQIAPAGSSGTAKNAWATALTIDSTRAATFEAGITASGQGFVVKATTGTTILWNLGVYGFTGSGTATQSAVSDTGISRISAGVIGVGTGAQGSVAGQLQAASLIAGSYIATPSVGISYLGPSSISFGGSSDTIISAPSAATFRHGYVDAASPVAQTIKFQDVVAGTTNTAGVNATIQAPAGTGTGNGGSLIFQVAPAGSSGSAKNAWATALTIAPTGTSTFANNVTINGVLSVNSNTVFTGGFNNFANYVQYTEMTAPAAPATNSVRFYAEDNGSGKTRLMALFATGAAQQVAIEP